MTQSSSLDYKPRISVAEFVTRQQQQQQQQQVGGDTAAERILSRSRIVVPVGMPEVLNVVAAAANSNGNTNIVGDNNKNKFAHTTTAIGTKTATTATMNDVRMTTISPTLSMNGNSNETSNVHSLSLYGPMSPQSSDSGHSMSDSMSHGKYYDGAQSSSSGSLAHHKELFTQRKQREFTPDNKKDDSYWDRRRRNNEAAKRSREKRRYNDMVLEQRVVELTKENHVLKAQLDAIRDKFNISGENLVSVEQILASLPTSEQVLSITKRAKISNSSSNSNCSSNSSSNNNSTSNNNFHNNPTVISSSSIPTIVYNGNTTNATSDHHATPTVSNNAHGMSVCNESLKSVTAQTPPHLMKSIGHASHLQAMPASATALQRHAISPVNGHHLTQTSPHHTPVHHPYHHYQHQQQRHSPLHDHYVNEAASPNHINMNSTAPTNNNGQIISSASAHAQNLPNLHVLQALNRNVNCDDIDNLRKVVAVVGAMTNNATGAAVTDAEMPMYNGAPNSLYAPASPATASSPHLEVAAAAAAAAAAAYHQHHHHQQQQHQQQHQQQRSLQASPIELGVSSSVADSVSSTSPGAASALNLSRRACSPNYEHMLSSTTPTSLRLSSSLSSTSSTGAISGDDEHDHEHGDDNDHHMVHQHRHHLHHHHRNVGMSTTSPNNSNDSNNSLPLKLRHKSHLGDKDAAATALLALQHIKQEPISSRASPPGWTDGGDNSSDERDSGISIGSAEWTAQLHQRKLLAEKSDAEHGNEVVGVTANATAVSSTEREHILKSQLARLESEVATIKNMMIFSADTGVVSSPNIKA